MHTDCQLIIALDVPSTDEALARIRTLGPSGRFYKVGLELFTSEGPALLQELRQLQRRVFLDLKLHDIPRTVGHAVKSAARHHVDLLTVHAHGGRDMLRAAADAAGECGPDRPRLLAVTTLTSLNQQDLAEIGITRPLAEHTLALGELAISCGIDGLVCSVHEAAALRARLGPTPILVTRGIRPAGGDVGDQKRVATPSDARRAGSSFIVVGRPILDAADPRAAAEAITQELEG